MMAGDGSGSATSSFPDPNPCSICLSQVTQDSYLDRCFHKFCYNCIKKWSNIAAASKSGSPASLKCPLCKTENFSIIHKYDGTAFQRDYVGKNSENSEFFSDAHRYRLKCYYIDQVNLADELKVSGYWKSGRHLHQNHFLCAWLKREIQAILQDEDVDIIVHHIIGVIGTLRRGWLKDTGKSTDMARQEFKTAVSEAIKPFLKGRAERFVSELELFMASGLNVDAFDKVYMKHLGWNPEGTSDLDDENEHESLVPYLHLDEEQDFD